MPLWSAVPPLCAAYELARILGSSKGSELASVARMQHAISVDSVCDLL